MRALPTMLLAACADPAPPVPAPRCPVGLCEARVGIWFDEAHVRVEVGGTLLLDDASVYGLPGPLELRIYEDRGRISECHVPIGATTVLSVRQDAEGPYVMPGHHMCHRAAPTADAHVANVLPYSQERIAELLALAEGALPTASFARDDDVNAWLHARGGLSEQAWVHRRVAEGAGPPTMVTSRVDLPADSAELVARFDGALNVRGRVLLAGERLDAFCRAWAHGGDYALVVGGEVRVTWTAAGACPGEHPWSRQLPQLPPIPSGFRIEEPGIDAVTRRWPLAATPEPPPPPGDAGAWIAARYEDPFARAKAVHDEVARGGAAFAADRMLVLGRAAGLEVVRIEGEALGGWGGPHAWNAVRIGQSWYPVDAAWDTEPYDTRWLFTPPEIFLATHFPADPAWQLVAEPSRPGGGGGCAFSAIGRRSRA